MYLFLKTFWLVHLVKVFIHTKINWNLYDFKKTDPCLPEQKLFLLLIQATVLFCLGIYCLYILSRFLISVTLFASVLIFNASLVVSFYCKALHAVKRGAIKINLTVSDIAFRRLFRFKFYWSVNHINHNHKANLRWAAQCFSVKDICIKHCMWRFTVHFFVWNIYYRKRKLKWQNRTSVTNSLMKDSNVFFKKFLCPPRIHLLVKK